MRHLPQPSGRSRLHFAWGTVLCGLLILFAIGTKLAWYHPPADKATSLAATKIWTTKSAAPAQACDVQPVRLDTALFSLLRALDAFSFQPAAHFPVRVAPSVSVAQLESSLEVRPPPASV